MLPAVLFAVAVASLLLGLAVLATEYSTEPPDRFLSGYGTSVGIVLIVLGCALGIALEILRVAS
jgi:hypothetical protein